MGEKYLQGLTDNQKNLVVGVLKLAHEFAPEAVAAMPYGVPGLRLKGKNLIAAAAHKNHLGIYPFSPKVVELVRGNMKDADMAEGTIRFKYGKIPSEKLIEKMVRLKRDEIEKAISK